MDTAHLDLRTAGALPDGPDWTPKYNVKAFSQLVGVSPVTLRAWERRYGLPAPQRGTQGYRLYSEYDVHTLRWLKSQIDAGLSISRAAQHLSELRAAGQDPVVSLRREAAAQHPASCAHLSARCLRAWIDLDDETAAEALRLAFGLYPIEQALVEVVCPALTELGERWHRGELPVAVEHFATQFCLRHLQSMAAAAGAPSRAGLIVAAGAPGEMHEIGLLMLVVLLRWRGWDVKYLGPNLKLDRLDEALAPVRPRLLLFSATRRESAEALRALSEILPRFPRPAPRVVVGGRAYSGPGGGLPGDWVVLDTAPSESVQHIEALMRAAG